MNENSHKQVSESPTESQETSLEVGSHLAIELKQFIVQDIITDNGYT